MKCPYCAEEIKDDAVVCRWCHRDFLLIKPLLDKIKNLERQIMETRLRVDQLTVIPAARFSTQNLHNSLWSRRAMVIIGLFALVYVLIFHFALKPLQEALGDFGWQYPVVASSLAFGIPFIAGITLGLNVIVGRIFILLLIGLAVGTAAALSYDIHSTLYDITFGGLGSALLLLAGSFLGRWMAGRWFGITPAANASLAIAQQFYTGKGLSADEADKRIKKLADAIAAFGPILTFLAAVLGAYLSYLGHGR